MNNYIKLDNKIAFHPGYYIQEIIEDSQLTQEEFATRMGITMNDLNYFIRGEKELSDDDANKLSEMLGTSTKYWRNLQSAYNEILADIGREKEMD